MSYWRGGLVERKTLRSRRLYFAKRSAEINGIQSRRESRHPQRRNGLRKRTDLRGAGGSRQQKIIRRNGLRRGGRWRTGGSRKCFRIPFSRERRAVGHCPCRTEADERHGILFAGHSL